MDGPIFGGAYVPREICVIKSVGLACSGKEIYHFCFVLLCIRGQIPSTIPPGGLYLVGRFNGGFFALRFWGAYTWRGLFSEFYGNVPSPLDGMRDARQGYTKQDLDVVSNINTPG